MFCGKRIFHSMQQEFFESLEIGFVFHLRAVQEPSLLETFDRGMNLRGTHLEICSDDRHGRTLAMIAAELQSHHYVLRF
jgi:hypothetical protein